MFASEKWRRAGLAAAFLAAAATFTACSSSGGSGSSSPSTPASATTEAGANSSAAGSSSTPAPANVTISFSHTTYGPGEEFYSYAVPKALGFFAKEGLTVDQITTAGSTASLQALGSKSSDVAFASAVNIAAAVEKKVPVKEFASYTLIWPYRIVTVPDSPIKSVADLKGKTLGVVSVASASYADAKAALVAAGLKPDVDTKLVVVGSSTAALQALQRGQIDALDDFTDDLNQMVGAGAKLAYLPLAEGMNGLFSVSLAARTDDIQNKADVLERVARAMFEGIVWSAAHPEDAVKIGCKEFPTVKCDGDQFQAKVTQLETSLKSVTPPLQADGTPQSGDQTVWNNWGYMSDDRWQSELKFAQSSESTTSLLTQSDVWDGSLVKAINTIDNAAVIATPPPA